MVTQINLRSGGPKILRSSYFNSYIVHLLLFCTMTNKYTINWQITPLL
jgi:hypothetical protein